MEFLLNHAYSFIFAFAAFIVFFVILAKFGVGPIVAAIEARDAKIKKDLGEAEEAYKKAQAMKADLDKQLGAAEARISEMINEARRDGEALKGDIVKQGQGEIDAMRTRTLREIDAARHAAVVALRAEVAEIAILAAKGIVQAEVDPTRARALVDEAVTAFETQVRGSKG